MCRDISVTHKFAKAHLRFHPLLAEIWRYVTCPPPCIKLRLCSVFPGKDVPFFRQMDVGRLVSRREDISALFPAETPGAKYKVGSFSGVGGAGRCVVSKITEATFLCQDLSLQFCAVRKVGGDGNCFYRAFCFAHLESVFHKPRALQRSAQHWNHSTMNKYY